MTDSDDSRWVWAHERRGATAADDLVIAARSVLAARRALEGSFPAGLLHDPALDILFSLYVDHAGGRRTTLSELSARTAIQIGVAERWTKALEQMGLVQTIAIVGPETLVALTDRGWADVSGAAQAVIRSQAVIHRDRQRDGNDV